AFEFGQVEVRRGSLLDQRSGVMKKIETEVEQRARHRFAVDKNMLLCQVPAARPDQKRRDLVVQPVLLALRTGEGDGAVYRVAEIELAFDIVLPGGRIGILKIRHKDAR